MGDSEFVGGGSVRWRVTHSNGHSGSGNPRGGAGRDKDPTDPNAQFTINITGLSQITVPVDGTTIEIHWPASTVSAARSTISKPTAMSTARRATTTKKTARSSKTARSAKTARRAKKK